jgi:hypothetical protein
MLNKYTIIVRQAVTHAIPMDAESSEEAKRKVQKLIKNTSIKDLDEPVSQHTIDPIEGWHVVYN